MRLPQPPPAAGYTRKSQGSIVDASFSLGSNLRALFSTSPGKTEAKVAHSPIRPEQANAGSRLRGEAGLMSHSQPLPLPSKWDLGGQLGALSPGDPGVPRSSRKTPAPTPRGQARAQRASRGGL